MTHFNDQTLNQYLDHELAPATYERLSAHLTTCEACQARLSEARQLFTALDELPELPLRVDLSRQVIARLTAELKPRPLPRWTLPIIALQLAAALALLISFWPTISPALDTVERRFPQAARDLLPQISASQLFAPVVNSLQTLDNIGQVVSPSATISIFEGFLIIGLGLMFWLAGSGLLLRYSLVSQNKSLGEG